MTMLLAAAFWCEELESFVFVIFSGVEKTTVSMVKPVSSTSRLIELSSDLGAQRGYLRRLSHDADR